jgi:hypothetical protein
MASMRHADVRDSQEGFCMATFRETVMPRSTLLDARDAIGPHHLAIGKTRKLFEHDGVVHAFYSRGYEIAHARLDAETLALLDTRVLPLPVAWGGGAFCVDNTGGHVAMVFVHRNQHELCFVQGAIDSGAIAWKPWRSLLTSRAGQAAPWLEMDADGTAWASVLDRDGDMRLAVIAADGAPQIGNLFETGETGWYHSCVQVLPIAKDKALAIGFRGTFPRETELVFKTVGRDLSLGPARTLAPCNVNDKLTFHFQAVGDAPRSCAHIVYLDDGLSVSHALYEDGEWRITRSVVPLPCFAPQIAIDRDGNATLVVAGYDRALWQASWSRKTGWSSHRRVDGAAAPNVSPTFAITGYGTGGLISAARSTTGRVPYLFAVMEDELSAHAKLYAAQIGDTLSLRGVSVRLSAKRLEVEVGVAGLREQDMKHPGRCWLVVIPAAAGRALKIAVRGGGAQAYWQERDGSLKPESAPINLHADTHDAFANGERGVLRLSVDFINPPQDLDPGKAWAELYASGWSREGGGVLADITPFDPETAARIARDPSQAPYSFRRMV